MSFLFIFLLSSFGLAGQPPDCKALLKNPIQEFQGFVRVSSGRDIFVRVDLPKSSQYKQPVFLVHGLLDSQKRFDKMTHSLLKKGHPVLRMDVYGFGRSLVHEMDRNNGDLRFLKSLPFEVNVQDIDDVLKWQKKRFGFGKVIALGHSMGGGLLGAWSARPHAVKWVEKLVLVAPYIYRLDRYQLESQTFNLGAVLDRFNPLSYVYPLAENFYEKAMSEMQSEWIHRYLTLHDPVLDHLFLNSYLNHQFSKHLEELAQDEIAQRRDFTKLLKEALVISAIATVKGLRDLDLMEQIPYIPSSLRIDLAISSQDELVPPEFQKKFGEKILARNKKGSKKARAFIFEGGHMLPSEMDEELVHLLAH